MGAVTLLCLTGICTPFARVERSRDTLYNFYARNLYAGCPSLDYARETPAFMSPTRTSATEAATRATASSSVTRWIGVPTGNAVNNREGIAALNITKLPRSSARRINRPNACANRARTMLSS